MSALGIPFLRTPVCAMLNCAVPVVLAGMGGVSRSELVAAVSEAGGFGFLGMVRESAALIHAEIARVREATTRDFGVNLIPAATDPDLLEAEIDAVIAERVAAVTLFWNLRPDIVRRLRDSGCTVVCQIGSVREAEEAATAGAHILIAQGFQAGGHVRGTADLAALVPAVVARVEVPVLAAGGIVDGRGLVAMLELGAQGVVIGTGFLATRESFAHDYHKQRIVDARPGETVHTDAFHINWPVGAPVRVLPNSVTRGECGDPFSSTRRVIGHEAGRPIHLFSTDSPLRNMTGDFEAMALYAGEGAGAIRSIPSAAERLDAIINEALQVIGTDWNTAADVTDSVELSSPPCFMHEADDGFMGYAGTDELLRFLKELLESTQAGMDRGTEPDGLAVPSWTSRPDGERWQAMLSRHVRTLESRSAWRPAAFDGTGVDARGNDADSGRGPSWVAGRLRAMLPRIRDARLHADLSMMLRACAARLTAAGHDS